MPKISAGLLMYRRRNGKLEVLLAHPGGPFWARKDLGAWTIPKGIVDPGEETFATAKREFEEELGTPPSGSFIPLGEIRQKGGKIVAAWAFEGDLETSSIRSNNFKVEWPPRSGRFQEYPEVDRAGFFSIEEARAKINPAQAELITRLVALVGEAESAKD